MYILKQSTSYEFDFRAIDASGLAVTGKVDGDWTKRQKKSGGAWGAMTITITEGENGWYYGTLTTTHSNTLGAMACNFSATGVVAGGSLTFVVEANRSADVVALLPTALDGSGFMKCQVKGMDANSIATGVLATDSVSSASVSAAAATKIQGSLATATNVSAVTTAISALLPPALVSGKMSSHVVTIATDAVDAASVKADAVTKVQNGIATASGVTSATSSLATAASITSLASSVATAAALSTLQTAVNALPSAATVATAVWAVAHESGRTVLGVMKRMDGLLTGKITGMIGSVFAIFAPDSTTKYVEATQDVAAGTRTKASTIAGD